MANVSGLPNDDDLCLITFEPKPIPTVGEIPDPATGGVKTGQVDVPGYEFDCAPSATCKEKNKKTNEAKKALEKAIKDLNDRINAKPAELSPADKRKEEEKKKAEEKALDRMNDADRKTAKDAAKKLKDEAEEKARAAKKKLEDEKKDLEDQLKKYAPECELTYLVGIGGNNPVKHHLTVDEIKTAKIQYVFCLCKKVPEPKDSKSK